MKQVVIVRYCEIHLKGKNRGYFEKVFLENLEKALRGIRHEIHRPSGRYIVDGFDEGCAEEIAARLSKVFGTHSVSVAEQVPADMEEIYAAVLRIAPAEGTFKVQTNRATVFASIHENLDLLREIGHRMHMHGNEKVTMTCIDE